MQTLPTMIISTHFQKYTQKHTSSSPKWTVQCFLLSGLKNVIMRNLRVFFTVYGGVVVHWTFYWKDIVFVLFHLMWHYRLLQLLWRSKIHIISSVGKKTDWQRKAFWCQCWQIVGVREKHFLVFEKLILNYLTLVGFTYGAFTRLLTLHPTPTK